MSCLAWTILKTISDLEIDILRGGEHSDARGTVRFFNDFDLKLVRRVYEVYPKIDQPRGWQAHKQERKWFYCKSGEIIVNLVKLDNFNQPSPELLPVMYRLTSGSPDIIAVPGGYASAFLASKPDSALMVYSDFSLEESQKDDYRFPLATWKTTWK